jgi:alkanesulfonate monooxygenase SsuD/methylene tetrahydromethanopterin reductase-like flavin-dependent oxidoreductase (luciferase family)
MLKVAGEVADGTVTWMAGRHTLESFVVPRITESAARLERPAPRIAAGFPVAVCDDEEAGRTAAARLFSNYANGPHYRRLIEMEGGRIEDIAVCGDEQAVERQMRALATAGVTHFYAYPYVSGDDAPKSLARTNELLASLVGKIE